MLYYKIHIYWTFSILTHGTPSSCSAWAIIKGVQFLEALQLQNIFVATFNEKLIRILLRKDHPDSSLEFVESFLVNWTLRFNLAYSPILYI